MGFMRLSNKHFVFTLLFMGCLGHPYPDSWLPQTPHLIRDGSKCKRLCVTPAPVFLTTRADCTERTICIHPPILQAPLLEAKSIPILPAFETFH